MKFTIDTIKDLKTKVKETNSNLLKCYTKTEFKPDNTFRLSEEQSEIAELKPEKVSDMISALKKNGQSWDEFESGKILFENLKLTPKQASDIGFWTYHNHYTFYKYITKRWDDVWVKEKKITNVSAYIINHWIQSNSSQGELIDYPISGLWWSFYLTVDEGREDKYELTKILFKNLSLRTKYFGQARFARHKPAITGALEFIKENKLENSLEQAGRAIYPYINLLGGIRPLSYFKKEWFKEKLQKRFGEQIETGQKLFVRPDKNKTNNKRHKKGVEVDRKKEPGSFDRFFCLNAKTRKYKILSNPDKSWDYCIGIDFEISNQFLIHFYKEGKIKKTRVNESLSKKKVDSQPPGERTPQDGLRPSKNSR